MPPSANGGAGAGPGTGFFERHNRPALYVPNLIGYARVLFCVLGFAIARRHPLLFILLYFGAFVCDELDGRFARLFNQSTTFGAVLDMVTDRMSTTCLLALVGAMYPNLLLVCLALLSLDIFSHWLQMYSSVLLGEATHKRSSNWIVNLYYQHRIFMGFCCVSCEVLYLAVFSLHPSLGLAFQGLQLPLPIPAPLWHACRSLASHAGIALPAASLPPGALLALLAAPGFLIKQVTNLEQLRSSSERLIEWELKKEGRKAR